MILIYTFKDVNLTSLKFLKVRDSINLYKIKKQLNNFVNLKQLNDSQIIQYQNAIAKAFPPIIGESQVIKQNWDKLESYFPEFQLFLLSADNDLIGFINTIPFQFQKQIDDLPENGWDWMFVKGITDYEHKKSPNFLGGLQVIVRSKYQKAGYSKIILNHAKEIFRIAKFTNLLIPIRPTKKHLHPRMPMLSYLNLKEENKIYDPWIRTHLKSGAKIVKICNRSMTMRGDIKFWETILKRAIIRSGEHILHGALSPISIDLENNNGIYIEPNIWIKYD